MSIVISIIFIALMIASIASGIILGFGKILGFAVTGIWGKILATIIFYSLFGVLINISFINAFLDKISNFLKGDSNIFTKILYYIRIETIILGVIFYFIVRISLKALADYIDRVLTTDDGVKVIINKVLGVLLALFLTMFSILIILQLLYILTGPTSGVYRLLRSTFLRLDRLYTLNPLNSIVRCFFR